MLEETNSGRGFALTGMMMAWLVLAIGILIAVVGTVQAMRSAGDVPVPLPPADTQALSRQIEELKIELDRERSEKQDLLQKLANAQPPPEPEPQPSEEAASSMAKTELQATDVEGEAEPEAAPPVEPPPEVVAAVPAVPAPAATSSPSASQASAPEPSLPTAMAPSAELMQQGGPAVAEAQSTGAATSFGVHLASFADRVMAERGWTLLQRNHPAALGDLTARIESATDDGGNSIYLLVAGPFETRELAAAHCRNIRTQVVFCKPRAFIGEAPTAVP
jgi:hypothetical protein